MRHFFTILTILLISVHGYEAQATLKTGECYSFESYNFSGYFIRHKSFLGEVTKINSFLDEKDASFKVVPGLADNRNISFESLNYPGHFLRHQGFRLKLHKASNDQLFKKDATFKVKPGLASGSLVSFESFNYPGRYIRHRDFHLYLETGNDNLFRKDATFEISPAIWVPEAKTYVTDRVDTLGVKEEALNVKYRNSPPKYWAKEKAHNWLMLKAFEFMRLNLFSQIPPGLDEKYLHYGLAFADSPWFGLPESFDSDYPNGRRVTSARQDLWGHTVANDCNTLKNSCVEVRYPWSSKERPNLYLHARYLFSFFEAGRPTYAVDNLSHYLHDSKLRADGTKGSKAVIVEGAHGRGNWKVKADDYGIELYNLARNFWPGFDPEPRLNRLKLIYGIGRLSNEGWTAMGDYAHVEVPATYLGGNPFVLTKERKATWPIWVPEQFSASKLTQNQPGRSKRASAIYLGWAIHMLHDMVQPFHSINLAGKIHSETEEELDKWIQEGKYDHLPILTPFMGPGKPEYKYSHKQVYWPDFWGEFTREDCCRKYSEFEMKSRFREAIQASKAEFDHIHPDKRANTSQSIAANEYLMDIALKNTIMMIACLDRKAGFSGTVWNEFHEGVSGATLTFVSEDGQVSKTTKSQGGGRYVITLPLLARYSVEITHPDYHTFSNKWYVLNKGGHHSNEFTLRGDVPPPTGVKGKVTDAHNNQPIRGADVCATEQQTLRRNCVKTNNSGYYSISAPVGSYTVNTSHPSYKAASRNVNITRGYTQVHFKLNLKTSTSTGGSDSLPPKRKPIN
jgi:hypothetical protein